MFDYLTSSPLVQMYIYSTSRPRTLRPRPTFRPGAKNHAETIQPANPSSQESGLINKVTGDATGVPQNI
ncbi:hypothetical protein R6G85_02665 [Actinotignum urinale]|uniref:hypothetical protein n=1 Tax=Actinotignum urinale TaxID=190146 RepID=UPI002A7F69EF|nr:hypothetical protein [Actinotignum urinale]MDY5151390.1 hypothetical protein [Actinotignum urinale]